MLVLICEKLIGNSIMNENYRETSVQETGPNLQEKEISIIDLFNILYSFRAFIVTFVFIASLGSIIYSLTVTPLYKAEVILFPAEENHSGGLQGSSMGSNLQLLMPQLSASGDKVAKHLSVLNSYSFLAEFIEKKELLTLLFYKDWDEVSQSWRDEKPSIDKAVRELKGVIEHEKETASGIIRVTLLWHDRELAALWANQIVTALNDHIRNSDIQDTRLSLEYIQEEIGQTSLKIPQNVLYNITGELTSKMMMANTRQEYAFEIIDYARTPEYRYFPQRTIMVVLSTFISFILACFISVLVNMIRNLNEN